MGKHNPWLRSKKTSQFNHNTGIKYRWRLAPILVLAVIIIGSGGVAARQDLLARLKAKEAPVARESVVTSALESQLERGEDLTTLGDLQKQDAALQTAVNQVINAFPSDQQWSVYVQDLNSTRSVSINANQSYDAGSLYKLFLPAPLEKKVPVDKWDYWWITESNIKYCIDSIFSEADDDNCAKAIGNLAKWDFIDHFNQNAGYNQTKLIESEPKTTARDVGTLLATMKRGKMLSDLARRAMFDALYIPKTSQAIAAGCQDCRTANKIAQTDRITHDAGIVTHGQHSYVIVVMSQGGSLKQISSITKAVDKELAP